MKRLFYIIMGIFLLTTVIMACKEEEETLLSSNCQIKNITLGQLKREIHYTDSTGKDTSYLISFSGAYYPLHINQVEQTILLSSPLPTGTRLDAVLASVTFEGVLFYRAWEPSAEDTTWHAFSASDSIDFREPLRFRVSATDGSGYRDYYLRIDCRTTEANAYTWEQVKSALCEPGDQRKLIAWQQSLFLMTRDEETGICDWMQSVSSDEVAPGEEWVQWISFGNAQELMADPATLVAYNDTLWVSSADGRQLWTHSIMDSDFKLHYTFDSTSDPVTLALFAGTGNALYGLGINATGQHAIYSSVDGCTWTPMAADDDMNLFPTSPVAVSYEQRNGNLRVLVAGQAGGESTHCQVWSLLEGADEPWTYFTPSTDNPYRLPVLADLSILSYNNLLIAVGGTDDRHQALAACYVSHDNGITWKSDGNLNVPALLQGTEGRLTATAYDGNIWVLAGADLWRARLNSYGETE